MPRRIFAADILAAHTHNNAEFHFPIGFSGILRQDNIIVWSINRAGRFEKNNRIFRQCHLPSVGIRPNVVYGPARDQGMSSAPTKAMVAAVLGQSYTVPFGGAVGFVYAREAAEVFIRAAAAAKDGAPVFDLNGESKQVAEVLDMIRKRLPKAQVDSEGGALPFPADLDDAPLYDYIGGGGRVSFAEGFDMTMDFLSAVRVRGDCNNETCAFWRMRYGKAGRVG